MNPTALPIREPFQPGESLTSFVRRHVVAMGYEHLGRLLSQAERTKFPRHLELLGRGPPLVALTQLLRRDAEELFGLTIHAWAETLVLRERAAPRPTVCDATDAGSRFFDFTQPANLPGLRCGKSQLGTARLVVSTAGDLSRSRRVLNQPLSAVSPHVLAAPIGIGPLPLRCGLRERIR